MSENPIGYEFYRKIGSPKFILAPMVDQSELAWRLLGRKYNVELAYTPMFHASNFVHNATYRRQAIEQSAKDRPLIYQFCANDPAVFTEAAKIAQEYCDAVDLNLGCPQSIAKRGHYGAFLQEEWSLIKSMLTKCVKELKVPVTVKIRAQSTIELTVEYAKMIESCGVSIITVHGRTREQKGVNTGLADWSVIKAVKYALKIPVFANGNIQYYEDVERCLSATGADGVMSAEGHLHNPAIFSKGVSKLVWDIALEYLEICKEHPCPVSYMRGHVFKLLQHALHYHTDIRDLVGSANNTEEFIVAVTELKKCCGPNICAANDELLINLPMKHWFCQPYARPLPNGTKRPAEESVDSLSNVTNENDNKAYMSTTLSEEVKSHRAEAKRIKTEAKRVCKENEKKKVRPELSPCLLCTCNQRGVKCEYSLCRTCCKNKRILEDVSCIGHVKVRNDHLRKEISDQSNNVV